MAKNSIADYSATAASNTDIQSVDIDEGCAPSGINNAIRELMADIAGELSPTADAQFAGVNYPAIAGIIESNAFVDACLVGPAVDGKAWSGKFENGSVWSSLMLATVETSGANAEVNIWDMTAGVLASASPLATVTLTGATPTSIAASMGYIIVGTSDQGIHIVDPHGGSWAERTYGWPRSLTASVVPVLSSNNVQFVSAGFAQQPPYDPRTGGPMPSFAVGFGSGGSFAGLIKHDGNVYLRSGTVTSGAPVAIHNGFVYVVVEAATDRVYRSASPIDAITADGWSYNDALESQSLMGADTALDIGGGFIVGADAASLLVALEPATGADLTGTAGRAPAAVINTTYSTGFLPSQTKLAALANSKTADRTDNANTLTENGTVTEAAVETGAELLGYSGWSGSNYLSRAYDADFDFGAATSFSTIGWFKVDPTAANEFLFHRATTAPSSPAWSLRLTATTSLMQFNADDTATNRNLDSGFAVDDGLWHMVIAVVDQGNLETRLYIDGVRVDTDGDMGNMSNGTAVLHIGQATDGTAAFSGEMSLWRISGSAVTDDQALKMYEAEKGMFVANAKCLLQGAGDAVLDARIDPITGKYIVTQSDTQDIFDGLTIETERTIASGGTTFEHGLLWGDGVAEINDANLYASMPATDQRQVNEMVRSMSADLPAGVDLSKAKAWIKYDHINNAIDSSYNVESVADGGAGTFSITWATPFKDFPILAGLGDRCDMMMGFDYGPEANFKNTAFITTKNTGTNTRGDAVVTVVAYGELENE